MKGAFGGRGDWSILSTTPAFQDSTPSSHALSELLAYGVAHGLCGSAPNERRVHFPTGSFGWLGLARKKREAPHLPLWLAGRLLIGSTTPSQAKDALELRTDQAKDALESRIDAAVSRIAGLDEAVSEPEIRRMFIPSFLRGNISV